MSLREELDKIVYAQRDDIDVQDLRRRTSERGLKDRLDEVRPLLTEFAEVVDDAYVNIRIADARVVIDVGDMRSGADSFEIDGRWELEPNPEVRFLAEPGAEIIRPNSGFVVWKTLYLRPLMDPDYLSWDRMEFDSGVEAFHYVFKDVARQIARHLRLKQATDDAQDSSPGEE